MKFHEFQSLWISFSLKLRKTTHKILPEQDHGQMNRKTSINVNKFPIISPQTQNFTHYREIFNVLNVLFYWNSIKKECQYQLLLHLQFKICKNVKWDVNKFLIRWRRIRQMVPLKQIKILLELLLEIRKWILLLIVNQQTIWLVVLYCLKATAGNVRCHVPIFSLLKLMQMCITCTIALGLRKTSTEKLKLLKLKSQFSSYADVGRFRNLVGNFSTEFFAFFDWNFKF